MFKNATHNHDVDLTTVRRVPLPGNAYQSMEEVNEAEPHLAVLSHMLSINALPVVIDTQKTWMRMLNIHFFIHGDVGLQGRICKV